MNPIKKAADPEKNVYVHDSYEADLEKNKAMSVTATSQWSRVRITYLHT